jgi:hypothetical protein
MFKGMENTFLILFTNKASYIIICLVCFYFWKDKYGCWGCSSVVALGSNPASKKKKKSKVNMGINL